MFLYLLSWKLIKLSEKPLNLLQKLDSDKDAKPDEVYANILKSQVPKHLLPHQIPYNVELKVLRGLDCNLI